MFVDARRALPAPKLPGVVANKPTGLQGLLASIDGKKKMSTMEKSKLDWGSFKDGQDEHTCARDPTSARATRDPQRARDTRSRARAGPAAAPPSARACACGSEVRGADADASRDAHALEP